MFSIFVGALPTERGEHETSSHSPARRGVADGENNPATDAGRKPQIANKLQKNILNGSEIRDLRGLVLASSPCTSSMRAMRQLSLAHPATGPVWEETKNTGGEFLQTYGKGEIQHR